LELLLFIQTNTAKKLVQDFQYQVFANIRSVRASKSTALALCEAGHEPFELVWSNDLFKQSYMDAHKVVISAGPGHPGFKL
jgi:hypothetical protein